MNDVVSPDNKMIFHNDLRSKLINQIIVSFILSLATVVLLISVFGQYFMTIDDARLLYVYAGYASGNPTGVYLFSNSVFGWILSILYTYIPMINWYYIYHLFVLLLFLTTLGTAIHRTVGKITLGSILVHLITVVLCFSNSILLMHFELATSLTGCTGLILLLTLKQQQSLSSRRWQLTVAGLLLLASYIQEKNAFYVIACFALLITLYKIIKFRTVESNQTKQLTTSMVAFTLSVLIGVIVLSTLQEASRGPQWDKYAEYNPYRISYWDYDHAEYDDDPELFLNAGWSKEFYGLVDEMYFLDPRFSAEGLSGIVDKFDRLSTSREGAFFDLTLSTLKETFQKEPKTLTDVIYLVSILTFLCMAIAYYKPRFKEILPDLACIILGLGGMCILITYLAWRGRLPLRAFDAVVFPALVTVLLVSLHIKRQISNSAISKPKLIFKIPAIAVIIVLIALNTYQIIKTFQTDQKYLDYRSRASAQVKDIEAYALKNQENLYVFDLFGAQNYEPRTHYPQSDLRNLLVWGSSYIYTPTYYEQIAHFGLEEVSAETFTQDNVYLVTSKLIDRCRNKFLAYIKSDYGYVALKIVDEIGDAFYVCEVVSLPDEMFQEIKIEFLGQEYRSKEMQVSFLGQEYRLIDGQFDITSADIHLDHSFEIIQYEDDKFLLDSYGTIKSN